MVKKRGEKVVNLPYSLIQELLEGFLQLVTKKDHDSIGKDISRHTKAALKRKQEESEKSESKGGYPFAPGFC